MDENKPVYKRPIDEYLPCSEYKGGEGFIKFFREDDKRYYFALNDANGKTYLRSQGYQNEPGRDNGIDSVIRNAPLDERWFDGYDEEEKYYYYGLKAGNRQEIARSCRYETKEEMQKDYTWVRGEESIIGKGAQEIDGVWWSAAALRRKQEEEAKANAPEEKKSDRQIDDYLPCEDYAGDEGFYKFYREDRGEYYFSLNDDNRKTYLRSEGYKSESARDNGIDSVIRNAPLDERWITGTAMDDKYYYYALKAANHQEIARSCYYKDENEMKTDLAWVRGERSVIGKGSKLVGGVLMSAFMLAEKEKPVPEPEPEPEPEPVKKAAPVAAAAAPIVDNSDKGGCSKWLWWLIPLILLLLLCYFFCRGCDDKVVETAPAAKKVVENVVKTPVAAAEKVVTKVLKPGDSFVLEGVNFVYDKDVITNNSKSKLAEAVEALKKYKTLKVEIQGYTDDRGNDAYNKKLSERRAIAIKNYLVKNGIEASRLTAVGYGERHPIATNSTPEGRAKNRRIEFKILEK